MTVSIEVDWDDDIMFSHEHSDVTPDVDSLIFTAGQTGDIIRPASGMVDIDNEPRVWLPGDGRLSDAQYLLWHYLRVRVHNQQVLVCRARFGRRNSDGGVNVLRLYLDTQNSTSLANNISVDVVVGRGGSNFWPPPGLTTKVSSASLAAVAVMIGAPVKFSGSEARYLNLLSQLLGGLFLDNGDNTISFHRWTDLATGDVDVKLTPTDVTIRGKPAWIPIDDFLVNKQILSSTSIETPIVQTVSASVARWGVRERLLPPWVTAATLAHTVLSTDLSTLSEPMRSVVLDCELDATSMTIMRQIGVGSTVDVDIDGTGRKALCTQTQLRLSRGVTPVKRCWFLAVPTTKPPVAPSPPSIPGGIFRNPFPPPPVELTELPTPSPFSVNRYLDYVYGYHFSSNIMFTDFSGDFPVDDIDANDNGDKWIQVVDGGLTSNARVPLWSSHTTGRNMWPPLIPSYNASFYTRDVLNADILVAGLEREAITRDNPHNDPTGKILDYAFHVGQPLPHDIHVSASVDGMVVGVNITSDVTRHDLPSKYRDPSFPSSIPYYRAIPSTARWRLLAWKITGHDSDNPFRDLRAAAPITMFTNIQLPTATRYSYTLPSTGLWVVGISMIDRVWGNANCPAFLVS